MRFSKRSGLCLNEQQLYPENINAWIEKKSQTFAFIQMEYCKDSLENIIRIKPRALEDNPKNQ